MNTLHDELLAHTKNRADKKVFGLVIQGGGMRAVYSAAALVTLAEYGFTDAFEHVVGASAGAINGAYFLARAKHPTSLYVEDLTNKRFVNLLRRDKKVDIDYVVDEVLKHKLPVDVKRLMKTPSKLNIVVTNARNGHKEVISDHHKFTEIYEEFRATAALPILYDKTVRVGDKWYLDGGVADLLPLDVAISLGCTDIVVLMTRQLSSYRFDQHHKRLARHLMRHFAKRHPAAIRRLLPTNERLLKLNLRWLTHPFKKAHIYLLEPSDEEMLFSLATIDKIKVKALAELGARDMEAFLHKPIEQA